MPSPKSNRKGKLGKRSSSFNGNNAMAAAQMRRPRTVPDLLSYRNHAGDTQEIFPRQPPKLLLKVTVLGSLGPVQVLMTPETTVGDLVEAAVRQYVKEGRRPILPSIYASDFDLHYSQFSLESLHKEEKLGEIGSRNFFLCPRKKEGGGGRDGGVTKSFASCATEVGKARGGSGGGFGWFKLMQFML